MELPHIAGAVSTVLFASSMIPMLAKAARTKDLASYSLSYIALSNLANAIPTVYILSLPAGPTSTGSDAAKATIASEALP
jgi:hypothetical protein